jgi:hypothetical protein
MDTGSLTNLALDFYQGNIGSANSKYFNMLQQLEAYGSFIKNAEKVLKLQENEDWVAIGDFFFYITST